MIACTITATEDERLSQRFGVVDEEIKIGYRQKSISGV
jgi:hypothetical protein